MITVKQLVYTCLDLEMDDIVRVRHIGEKFYSCTVSQLLELYGTDKVVSFMTEKDTMLIILNF